MEPKPTTADLLGMLKGIAGRTPEKPDEGFHSATWWALEWNIHPSKAREYITSGIEAGVVERRDYLISKHGVRRKVPHYKINQLPTQ